MIHGSLSEPEGRAAVETSGNRFQGGRRASNQGGRYKALSVPLSTVTLLTEHFLEPAQFKDLVAQKSRLLELELFGGFLHLSLEVANEAC